MLATKEWVKSLMNKCFAKNNTYTTTEQKIGTWIDGKPIYRKVLDITSLIKNTTTLTTNNIAVPSGLKEITRCEFLIDYTNWAVGACTCYNTSTDFQMEVGLDKGANKLYISQCGQWATNLVKGRMIVEYTKTTD